MNLARLTCGRRLHNDLSLGVGVTSSVGCACFHRAEVIVVGCELVRMFSLLKELWSTESYSISNISRVHLI